MRSTMVIIPVMTQFDMMRDLIKSIDGECAITIIPNWVRNRGVAASWNWGLDIAAEAGFEAAVVCNDDITFYPGSLGKMVESLDEYDLVSAGQNSSPNGTDIPVEGADFFCFAVKPAEFLERFGLFDETIWPAYFEDNDMHYRIRLEGGKCLIRRDAPAFHHGSATQNADINNPNCPPARFEGIRDYYVRKWGGRPGQETFTTPWNLPGKPSSYWGHDEIEVFEIF